MSFFDPSAYVILPWEASRTHALPDHLRCTYELIISLAYSRDGNRTPPVTRRELATWRGLAIRTIDDHLAALRERGLIRNDPTYAGACLVIELVQPEDVPHVAPDDRPEGAPLDEESAPPQPGQASSAKDTYRSARPPNRPTIAGRQRRTAAPNVQAARRGPRPTTALEEEAYYSPLDREYLLLAETLLEAGVFHGVAQRIAGLPWVTLDLARRWVAVPSKQQKVRHVGAVLAATLQDPKRCFPPPPLPEEDWCDETALQHEPCSLPPDEPPALTPPATTLDWSAVLSLLRGSLGEERTQVWFGEARPISQGESDVVIAVGSPLALDWISKRCMIELREAVAQVAGEPLHVGLTVARLEPG